MPELGRKQRQFVRMIGRLIEFAYARGFELSFGDAYRDPRVTYGNSNSLHRKRLAVDFNLFRDGKFLTDGTGHSELHDFWDSFGGAERIPNDLNHYSLEHEGIR